MRILFITHHYLTSPGGGSYASRANINAFARNCDRMTLLYPVSSTENLFDGIEPNIEAIPVEYSSPKIVKLWNLICGRVHRYLSVAKRIGREREFDVVVFDTSMVSFGLIDFFKKKGCRIITIHHNWQYEFFRDNTSWPMRIPVLFWCRKYEGEAVRKSDLNLTLTMQDIDLLSKTYCNGDKSDFRLLGTFEHMSRPEVALPSYNSSCHRFVITGDLGAIQTRRSLMPWLKSCFPILKDVFPDLKLTIAGKNPDRELSEICDELGVGLVADPPNVDDILADADCYICPVCYGGGIKLRIMDGVKMGMPVIAHAVSARGYEKFLNKTLFQYSDEESFREAALRLKALQLDRSQIKSSYREWFSFESGVSRVAEILL